MAGNLTNLTNAPFIPEIWAKEVLRAREKQLVLAQHIARFDREIKAMGDTVHVPRRANRTASTLAIGASVTYNATTEGELVISIDTQAYDAFILPDALKTQSQPDIMAEYQNASVYALKSKIDSDLFALKSGISQTVGTAVTTTGIAKTFILGGIEKINLADAPDDDRWMTIDGYGYTDLLNIDDFVRYDANGKGNSGSPIVNGEIGELYGLGVLRTNNQANAANLSYSYIFHKDAFALAMQKDLSVKTEDSVDYIGTKVVTSCLYGATIARTDHAVVMQYGIA